MSSSNRVGLFIDGPNLYATAKALGFDIDYRQLLTDFQKRGTLVRASYYTAIIEDQEYSSIRPLIDWLNPKRTSPPSAIPHQAAMMPRPEPRGHQ